METRVPIQHYNIRAGNSFIGGSLHDLNTVEARHSEIDGISDVDREAVTEDSLENEQGSNSVDCMHESYRNSLTLHGVSVSVEEEHSVLDDSSRPSSPPYNILTSQDVLPIETARARFLDLIVDHFIAEQVIPVPDSSPCTGTDYCQVGPTDKLTSNNKRKPREIRYEGDSRLALPLMYIANLYEGLVNDVNARLASLHGIRDKTIGVSLEASGGLYRKLANKFPKKGPISFRRRELATSHATRTQFPELVVQDEKRVRFVVINGLIIVEKPNTMSMEDSEWFKILTGRREVAVTERDYKYYSPRHKYRRSPSQPAFNIPESAALSGSDSSPLVSPSVYRQLNEESKQHHTVQPQPVQPQFHPIHHHQHHDPQHQMDPQNQHQQFSHVPQNRTLHIPYVVPDNSTTTHLSCLQSLTTGHHHLSSRFHLPTGPAKFCDECGSPYLRETSKFCSECGTKRLGI